jgi:hypothetical protein
MDLQVLHHILACYAAAESHCHEIESELQIKWTE